MYSDKIKEIINKLNITQSTFSRDTGISKAYLSEIVNGKVKSISADKVKSICDRYNLSPDWFLYSRGEMYQEGKILDCVDILIKDEAEIKKLKESLLEFKNNDGQKQVHIKFIDKNPG